MFRFPRRGDGRAELTAAELAMLLEGIELRDVKRRKRYRRGAENTAA
ncbi:MAG: hypothetical protein GTO30_05870 [Acidobacteria bacterium]|nr:hypothetical protein [Acidobacteriota bacterium]NIQ83576.1 hypothetical protein [Acidobacteriota bacterium]NIT36950.1 hypothetical protein [candidate division Zixibacteria bacterium]